MTNNTNNSTSPDSDSQIEGFNHTGILLLKPMQNKIEYRLYDTKIPYPICVENWDVNESLELHTYKNTSQETYIHISSGNELICEGIGKLNKYVENGVDKYYLITGKYVDYIDLERILFNSTEKTINIKINTFHNEEVIVDEKGSQADESREEQQS